MTNTTKNTTIAPDIDEAVEAVIAEAAVAEAEAAAWMTSFPSELKVEFRDEIGKKTVTLKNKNQEWVLWAITNGLRQSIADAIAGKAKTEEGKRLILAKYERVCINGEVPSGGGGGGAKLSIEVAGRIAFYNAKGSKLKIKGQVANGKNIKEYDLRFVKQAIWDDLRNEMASMDETEQRAFVKDEVPQIVKDNLESVLNEAMQDLRPAMMGDFVESEKRKRTGQTAPTFKAKAKIVRRTEH